MLSGRKNTRYAIDVMATPKRIEKLKMLLGEEVSKILDRDMEFPEGSLVTITRVALSPDVRYASVFMRALGADSTEILALLKKNIYDIQQKLNRAVRMRPVPKIRFAIDEEELRRESVERSLSHIKQRGEM